MKKMRLFSNFLVISLVSAGFLFAETSKSLELNDPIPVDNNITIGHLDNGLTYYIKVNKKPEQRAELRLAVNAGSVLEDDNQQGLAHFAEHMAFNGTKQFEKHELIDYLESIGMDFGPEINAYTGFDETVYMLEIPTDSLPIVETAFQILQEWAHNVSYDSEEIDKERGVIIEEWRQGRGANARMRDKQLPIVFSGSKYAERLPIGKKDILENFGHETLVKFYKDWYRPDLMAVVAVGDFDKTTIEKLIRKNFSSIPSVPQARQRNVFPVPDHNETLFAIASDPEATGSSVSIYYKNDLTPEKTVSDYRRSIVERLYNSMFNLRLDELLQQSEPPFLYAVSAKGRFVRSKGVYYLAAAVKDNGLEKGLDALMTEAERVKKFGFTQSELDRTKTEMLRRMERLYAERDKTESSPFAEEFIRNFLHKEPIPGIEYEYEIYKKYIPGILLSEVNELANKWIQDKNRVILVDSPKKQHVKIPTEQDLLAVFDTVKAKQIEAYVDNVSDEPLLAKIPEPVQILNEKKMEKLGVTEWILENGVRVVLKSTDFKNDEIRFNSFSPGGNSLIEDADYIAALTASTVIREGGLGEFDQIELDKKLTGKVVRVSPFITTLTEGVAGAASPQDMETMFQLLYMTFTAPRRDDTAFQSYQARMKGFIENRSARPETAFQDTIQVTMAQNHFRARPWTMEILDEMDLEKSLNIYRDRFADASDFTFFFVGNFDLETIKPYVQRYLGGLPDIDRKETWKDVGINSPEGRLEKKVKKGIEPKSQVKLFFTGPYEWSRENNYALQSMVSAMRIKLREAIREDKSGTYGVSIGASRTHFPKEEYEITISFGCSPDRVEELTTEVLLQIDTLQTMGLDDIYVTKVKESQLREYETNLKKNGYWLNALKAYYMHDQDPVNILNYKDLIKTLSLRKIQRAGQKYFNTKNYVRIVLYPEKNSDIAKP